jgi:hypothetical protein
MVALTNAYEFVWIASLAEPRVMIFNCDDGFLLHLIISQYFSLDYWHRRH